MAMPAAHSNSMQQHQAASLDQDSAVAPEGPSVDSWSEKDQRIVVSQPASGFLYDLILRAKVCGLGLGQGDGSADLLACMRARSCICAQLSHRNVPQQSIVQALGVATWCRCAC
jgi:hypothetical protein